jgi:flagellar basal-body rod protein FlgF
MDRLIYTALTGMNARSRELVVTANNLANAQVPGFRRELVAQEGRYLDVQRAADGAWKARAQVGSPSLSTPEMPGKVQATARGLDVALPAKNWLAVQGPVIGGAVKEAYTRRGDLSVSSTGLLVNGDGRVMLGTNNAPISVPPGAALVIAHDGRISAQLPDGPAEIGQLKLVDGTGLTGRDKASDGLFVPEAPLPRDPAVRIETGALESANITAVEAMIELAEEQRSFEASARMIRLAQDMDEQGARLMRLDT